MYVRVKRQKTTIFINTEPQESGLELKAKLQKLLDGKVCTALSQELTRSLLPTKTCTAACVKHQCRHFERDVMGCLQECEKLCWVAGSRGPGSWQLTLPSCSLG